MSSQPDAAAVTALSGHTDWHRMRGKPFGFWLRFMKATEVMPAAILPEKPYASFRRFVGLAGKRTLVVALRGRDAPRHSLVNLGKALPTTAPWCGSEDTPKTIQWLGECAVSREPIYTVRVYIPKHVLQELPPFQCPSSLRARLWIIEAASNHPWYVVEADLKAPQ